MPGQLRLERSLPGRRALEFVLEHASVARRLRDRRHTRHWRLYRTSGNAVAEVIHGEGGGFDHQMFVGKYGEAPRWREDSDRYSRKPTLLGLFLMDIDPKMRGSVPRVPEELAARLAEFVPPPREEVIESAEEPVPASRERPLKVAQTERTAQRELLAVLRRVDTRPLQVSDKTKRPSKKGVAAVTGILEGGDFYAPAEQKTEWGSEIGSIRAFAWPLIVRAAGLAKVSGPRLALTRAGRSALAQPAPRTLRKAWGKWLNMTIIDEFSRIDVIKGQSGRRLANDRKVGRHCALAGAPPARPHRDAGARGRPRA